MDKDFVLQARFKDRLGNFPWTLTAPEAKRLAVTLLTPVKARPPSTESDVEDALRAAIRDEARLVCNSAWFQRECPWITMEQIQGLLQDDANDYCSLRDFLDVRRHRQPLEIAVIVAIFRAYKRTAKNQLEPTGLVGLLRSRVHAEGIGITLFVRLRRATMWHEWRPLDQAVSEARRSLFCADPPLDAVGDETTESPRGNPTVPLGDSPPKTHSFSTFSLLARRVFDARLSPRDVRRRISARTTDKALHLASAITTSFGLGHRWTLPFAHFLVTGTDAVIVSNVNTIPTIELMAPHRFTSATEVISISKLASDPFSSNAVIDSFPNETLLDQQLLAGFTEQPTQRTCTIC